MEEYDLKTNNSQMHQIGKPHEPNQLSNTMIVTAPGSSYHVPGIALFILTTIL